MFYLITSINEWIDAPQAERSDRSCVSIGCFALSLTHLTQEERDNESCFYKTLVTTSEVLSKYPAIFNKDKYFI